MRTSKKESRYSGNLKNLSYKVYPNTPSVRSTFQPVDSVSDLTCCLSCQITFSGFGSFIWNWSRSPSNAVKILCISKPCWIQVCVCTEKGFMVYGCVPGHVTRNCSSICRTEGCRKFSLPPVLYSEAFLFWKTL